MNETQTANFAQGDKNITNKKNIKTKIKPKDCN